MTEQPSDNLWEDFDKAEALASQQMEERYQEIEGYNAEFINQIVGITDSVYRVDGVIESGERRSTGDTGEIRAKPFRSLMFVQPDRRQDLINQGETKDSAAHYGDPHVIRGEVPQRSQKLIDDLLSSCSAVLDKERSEPEMDVYRGNVAGQPIDFEIHKQVLNISVDSRKFSEDTMFIWIEKVKDHPRDDGRTDIDSEKGENESDGQPQPDESSPRKSNSKFRAIRNRIFPPRKKY